ncbi:hypothetical protein QUC32_24090 [Novosphingobium resinovorum]|jgi:hypothetical protein|uniref:hypothetical protein n=1 Tax=Sphingomonadaceae TaxID=41297 RepID=UPI00155EA0DF|nr:MULTISPECIES: hypothetical protein [Sphingomonadaceae]MBF7012730.1 hypothetical protein [Novosphingobium sp. HR1a]WJM27462.1 hypothetical protein QUC32_24090 [Novosphingobium resinovorum]
MTLGTSSLDPAISSSAIDGETIEFGIWPKSPMISKALFFVGVADGIVLGEKYFFPKNQSVRMLGNNRVGVSGKPGPIGWGSAS